MRQVVKKCLHIRTSVLKEEMKNVCAKEKLEELVKASFLNTEENDWHNECQAMSPRELAMDLYDCSSLFTDNGVEFDELHAFLCEIDYREWWSKEHVA